MFIIIPLGYCPLRMNDVKPGDPLSKVIKIVQVRFNKADLSNS